MNYLLNSLECTGACIPGLEYLHMVQKLVWEPTMVDAMDNFRDRIPICTWIGENIDTVNTRLNLYLQACHGCFHVHERQSIQIFAVPLAQSLGIDGLCNIFTNPITILIDVGRIAPEDWLRIVVHEYAHAHLGEFGHNRRFATILWHLCLGLAIEPPSWQPGRESDLSSWPNCQSTIDPLALWRGESILDWLG